MKSWKTTLAGSIGAVGAYLASTGDATLVTIGKIMAAAGVFLMGLFARDNGVSSEDVGIK